ncbi:MAG: DUF932 domain-containing protein [Verrucomicrobia bacterium]|nr:MAG: DUF932 domain-containing protein [Verrucomicrobiota bacterium]
MELMQANRQWATRPDDERFLSLIEMQDHFARMRSLSREKVVASRQLSVQPAADDEMHGLVLVGPNGGAYAPTNWSFGQLAQLADKAPASYLRRLPAPLAADCINYGLKVLRDVEDVGVLICKDGAPTLKAATGPRYGRIWNSDIVSSLVDRIGDGVTGDWRVPGEFGKAVQVTRANTTLYAGDRDMFIFLADEQNRIEIPNRRNGRTGSLARGFFIWNSEVGSKTFGLGTFLFDYVCCNRIVWGASEYKEITIRHTPSAPVRWFDEMAPAIAHYSKSSAINVVNAIRDAQDARIQSDVAEFMQNRFGKKIGQKMMEVHMAEEGRPVETLWDATTAATAYARTLPFQDARVEIETKAGELIDLAA